MLGAGRTFTLGRLFGIRIGASPTWFAVLFLMIYYLSGQFAFGVAVAATVAFFVSLVAHELGHALTARRLGIGIDGIDLWFFGGLARLSRDTRSPGEEVKVAGAGPLVTLVIAAVAYAVLEGLSVDADSAAGELLSWTAFVNGVLLVFNLVPAFPLDGGRLARAAAWKLTGDRGRGTRIAARMGQAFGVLLIGGGVALALAGDALDGVWLAVLGWFLLQAAGGAVVSSRFTDRLDGLTAADVMLDDDGPAGWAGADPQAERDEWLAHAITADAPVEELLTSEPLKRLGSLPVVDAEGRLQGVVTLERVRRVLTSAATA